MKTLIKNLSKTEREVICNCYLCCCCPYKIDGKASNDFYCKLDSVNLKDYGNEGIEYPEKYDEMYNYLFNNHFDE